MKQNSRKRNNKIAGSKGTVTVKDGNRGMSLGSRDINDGGSRFDAFADEDRDNVHEGNVHNEAATIKQITKENNETVRKIRDPRAGKNP